MFPGFVSRSSASGFVLFKPPGWEAGNGFRTSTVMCSYAITGKLWASALGPSCASSDLIHSYSVSTEFGGTLIPVDHRKSSKSTTQIDINSPLWGACLGFRFLSVVLHCRAGLSVSSQVDTTDAGKGKHLSEFVQAGCTFGRSVLRPRLDMLGSLLGFMVVCVQA